MSTWFNTFYAGMWSVGEKNGVKHSWQKKHSSIRFSQKLLNVTMTTLIWLCAQIGVNIDLSKTRSKEADERLRYGGHDAQ